MMMNLSWISFRNQKGRNIWITFSFHEKKVQFGLIRKICKSISKIVSLSWWYSCSLINIIIIFIALIIFSVSIFHQKCEQFQKRLNFQEKKGNQLFWFWDNKDFTIHDVWLLSPWHWRLLAKDKKFR